MSGTLWTYTGTAKLPNGKYLAGFRVHIPDENFVRIIQIPGEYDTREEASAAAEIEREKYIAIAEAIGLVEPSSSTKFGSINPN